jgi:DNA-binding response OmpR family regulator
MPRILLVDDDPALLDVVAMAFEDAGFAVETAGDGISAMAAVNRQRPDLVVTDVNMPRLDGLGLCRRLRRAWPQLPVILLTSRDAELDEAMALEDGADDYITKPFSTRVLLARAGALLRRGAGGVSTVGSGPRHLGPLRIDLDRVEVRFYDQPVVVTMGELRLLDVLTRRPGMVFSRDAQRRAAAMKLIAHLTSPDVTNPWAVESGYLPLDPRASDSALVRDYLAKEPRWRVAFDQMQETNPPARWPGY